MSIPIRLSAAFVKSLVRSKDDTAIKRCRKQRKAQASPTVSESHLQKLIVDYLEVLGFVVIQTGQFGMSPERKVNTVGTPDLIVHHPRWERGKCLVIELKTAIGTLSKEQQAFYDAGVSYVVRSLERLEIILQQPEWGIDE